MTINKYLSHQVEKSLTELSNSYCLEIGEDNRTITPLTLGRIASYYYLKHLTIRGFCDQMKADNSVAELLDILANAHEFAELPVRHNEDQINAELAKQIVLPVSEFTLDSAHTKANILLQAYFSHLALPSSDYHTDTKSVMDQAIRVLQAMLDISADQGWLVTSLHVITLIQMVVQGRWHHDHPLLTLPHLQPFHVARLRVAEPKGIKGSKSQITGSVQSLPELIALCDGRMAILNSMLGPYLDAKQIDQVYDVLTKMPQIEVRVELSGWMEGNNSSITRPVKTCHQGGVRSKSDWLPVHADQEYVLNIELKRINRTKKADSKAFSSRFPKPKDEGWILVVGNVDARELVALKRVGYIRGRTNVQMSVFTPESQGRVMYTLYLMSDAYLGLDQQYDLCLEVIQPSMEAQVNSEVKVDKEKEGW